MHDRTNNRIKTVLEKLSTDLKKALFHEKTKGKPFTQADNPNDSAHDVTFAIVPGQGVNSLKTPRTNELAKATKTESHEVDEFGYVIHLKRTAF